VRDAWVDRGELTDKASDHYPVGAELALGEE
jgi:endonuclease/exonuclease/phosphatase family metal-dependent hydrolase